RSSMHGCARTRSGARRRDRFSPRSMTISATPASGRSAKSSTPANRTPRVAVSRRHGALPRCCGRSSLLTTRPQMRAAMRPEAAVTAQPRLGAVARQNRVDFAVWAPAHREVGLVLEGKDDLRMDPRDEGYFVATVSGVHHGQRYWYRLGGQLRPDPASRFQPDGPFGPSMVVD